MRYLFSILLLATLAASADDYTGPRPPKADVLYLVHASNLIPTEVTEAQQEGKNNDTFSVSGPESSARTPLSEPIFLLRSEKIKPDTLELYRFDVKGGRRQLTMSRKRSEKSGPFHLSVTKLDKDLYRVEADEALEDGEYSLSPSGSNTAFCFQIY
jgi:hypothetical protein